MVEAPQGPSHSNSIEEGVTGNTASLRTHDTVDTKVPTTENMNQAAPDQQTRESSTNNGEMPKVDKESHSAEEADILKKKEKEKKELGKSRIRETRKKSHIRNIDFDRPTDTRNAVFGQDSVTPQKSHQLEFKKGSITIGELVQPEDWRSADMLALSPSCRRFFDDEILNEVYLALPSQLFKEADNQCSAKELASSGSQEKPRFLVPLTDMRATAPEEAIATGDEMWRTVSSLAVEKKAKKLVVIPSYPLGSNAIQSLILAKNMINAIHRGLGGNKELEIRIAARDTAERRAFQQVLEQ